MISKTYMKKYAQFLEEHKKQEQRQKFLEQFCSIYNFEHIGVDMWKVPNSECNAKIGEKINARFVDERMKFKGDYHTQICNVYKKDAEYTYIISIY